jgi:hypothetical protein
VKLSPGLAKWFPDAKNGKVIPEVETTLKKIGNGSPYTLGSESATRTMLARWGVLDYCSAIPRADRSGNAAGKSVRSDVAGARPGEARIETAPSTSENPMHRRHVAGRRRMVLLVLLTGVAFQRKR